MPTMRSRQRWTLDVRQEWVDITFGLPTPNERWTYTDRAGHLHNYLRGYPTLTYIEDAGHWCDGTEGFERHDPHWAVDESHYECPGCGEVIEPLMDPPYTPKKMPGMTEAMLRGIAQDGSELEVVIASREQMDDLTHRLGQVTTAELFDGICDRFVDAHPDQIISRSR